MSWRLAQPLFVLMPLLAAACLGDVPPFQGGEGGEGGAAGAISGSAAAVTGTTSSSGSGGATSSTSTAGAGGSPATSTSTGSSECGLDRIPSTCGEALVAFDCAGLGGEEDCTQTACSLDECVFPVATFFHDAPPGYCTFVSSGDPPCFVCDGAGPAIALASTDVDGPMPIAAFPPGMPALVHFVARGEGRFQLEWRVDATEGAFSEVFTLTPEHATYDVAITTSSSFELRVQEASGSVENAPLWMEVDCAFTVDLASGRAPSP